jgi:chromosomal replication initiator protein
MDRQWSRFLELAARKLNPLVFQRWFLPLRAVEFGAVGVTLTVPSEFFLQSFNERYLDFLRGELAELFGVCPKVELVVASRPLPFPPPAETMETPPAPVPIELAVAAALPEQDFHRALNQKYTFESFVVGPSNQFVHAACMAVAEMPGSNYNPLFIYGGVGLGKTHLLNAIGHRIREKRPTDKIIYLHSEQFVNEVITSIRYDKILEFQNKYRQECDVLLIDDIQFIAGKDRTQVEFFHVFNALHQRRRQIVMTSDKFPQEIPQLEERLRSRFQWGLIADIQPPEMETRVAILMKKADQDGIHLPDEIAFFLATHIKSHVRELEGCLTRLAAFASLHGRSISIELASEVLKDLIKARGELVTVEHIQRIVASYYNVKVADLKGDRRSRVISMPRQIAMYLCRKHTRASFPDIGNRFGGKDHSTVVTAFQKIEKLVESDPQLKASIENIEKNLS